jgi:hypothetical protein
MAPQRRRLLEPALTSCRFRSRQANLLVSNVLITVKEGAVLPEIAQLGTIFANGDKKAGPL